MINFPFKKILVTGGAGYIGSHLVNLLSNDTKSIITVVDSFRESRNNVQNLSNVFYEEVDIRDKKALSAVFKKAEPEIVFHFAGLASVPDSMKNPFDYYDHNVIGGINLLECMREIGTKNIIFSSSASTYGEPLTEVISENHQQVPTNTYGYTKLIFENILKDYKRAYGFSSVSLRYFCASGCDVKADIGEYHNPETHVIPSLALTALGRREEFFIYGNDFATPDGTGVRDYIHVIDLAEAHIKAMEKIKSSDGICEFYNLGINKGFSVKELIDVTEKVSGKKLKYSFKERRMGDPSRLIANSNKAQKELNWKPKFVDIKDMVGSTYTFLKNK